MRITQNVSGAEVRLGPRITNNRYARTAFISQKLRDELNAYAHAYLISIPEHALFCSQKNPECGFTPDACAQHFLTLCKLAVIENASSDSGRRNFITGLANKGTIVRALASLADHRSIAITQRYIDVNDDMKHQVVELI